MKVTEERGCFVVVCAPCGYRSKPYDQRAKANGAAVNHRTGIEHRRRARLAGLRGAA
jgi:hypothetical protein